MRFTIILGGLFSTTMVITHNEQQKRSSQAERIFTETLYKVTSWDIHS